MSAEERELVGVLHEPQWERQSINNAIGCLAGGGLPMRTRSGADSEVVKQAIRIPLQRYEAGTGSSYKKREAEILATPIDDAAWEQELKRRAELANEDRSKFIHVIA